MSGSLPDYSGVLTEVAKVVLIAHFLLLFGALLTGFDKKGGLKALCNGVLPEGKGSPSALLSLKKPVVPTLGPEGEL